MKLQLLIVIEVALLFYLCLSHPESNEIAVWVAIGLFVAIITELVEFAFNKITGRR